MASGRVLLIESDVPSMERLCHLLTSYGYSPLRARNGEEGIKLAARERPDLIVSNMQMQFVDGYEVARRIRADPVLQGIPLIALGAFTNSEDRRKALVAGFDGYMSKPVSPESLARHIEAFLRPEFRAGAARGEAAPAGSLSCEPGARRILVVDDTPTNLELVARLLGRAGYRVDTATGMSEALRIARGNPPDLILSDIVMADGSGYEFIRAIKGDVRLRSIPFIFNTASMAVETARSKCLALGAVRVLFHPIDSAHLLREIEACLAEPAAA